MRIRGELLKLGRQVSATSIRDLLHRHGIPPAPQETGSRAILLMPVPVLAEIVSRVGEGMLSVDGVDRIMVEGRGLLAIEDLPDAPDHPAAMTQPAPPLSAGSQ